MSMTDGMRERTGIGAKRWRVALITCVGVLLLAAFPSVALAKTGPNEYTVHPLVSDLASLAPMVDPNLINGWGIAAGPTTPWWVSDNGADKATVYTETGTPFIVNNTPLVVGVDAAPTGVVFNPFAATVTTAFQVNSQPARFLFATENGTILGWIQGLGAAVVVKDRSGVGAVYKGLAIGSAGGNPYLYATDFVNGRIDVFDGAFTLQNWAGAFVDPRLPKGYGPFGIQAIGDRLFVTYAKQNPPSHDEKAGQGRGFVDEFSMDGKFVARVASHGRLNAPWGLAIAPSGFGRFSGCLLVGNFGDGHINAYVQNPKGVWVPRGTLRTENGKRLFIEGLWGIGFGHGNANSGPTNTLYFAAGPDDESHGLFGSITAP